MAQKRNLSLKPRKPGKLPPERLLQILNSIYPEETSEEIMKNLGFKKEKEDD